MTEMTVIDPGNEDLALKIASCYSGGLAGSRRIHIKSVRSPAELRDERPDILVLSADVARQKWNLEATVACGILLLPGDAGAENFDASCLVTYGMSPKNTITLSSISEDVCVLALQREILTATGDILEQQEIKINGGIRPDTLLAVAGALLLLGQKPPDINL